MLNIRVRVDERKIKEKLRREADKELQSEVLAMLKDLATATPIDTGRASSSWDSVKLPTRGYEISNPVEYIKYLNAGSSQQAPANFIERIALTFGRAKGPIVKYKS